LTHREKLVGTNFAAFKFNLRRYAEDNPVQTLRQILTRLKETYCGGALQVESS
jgi:hypothetical protein